MLELWSKAFYYTYKIKNKQVMIGSRPFHEEIDRVFPVDVIISLTDRHLPYKQPIIWAPWVEVGPPSEEVIFVAISGLYDALRNDKVKTIYMHCDAGTHRAPTILGFYLDTFFSLEDKRSIVKNRYFNIARKEKENNNEEGYANPLYYAKTYYYEPSGEAIRQFLAWIAGPMSIRASLEDYLKNHPRIRDCIKA